MTTNKPERSRAEECTEEIANELDRELLGAGDDYGGTSLDYNRRRDVEYGALNGYRAALAEVRREVEKTSYYSMDLGPVDGPMKPRRMMRYDELTEILRRLEK